MKKNIKIYVFLLLATFVSTPVFSDNKTDKQNSTLDGVWAFKGHNVNGSNFSPNSRSIYKTILNGKYITFCARLGGADITGEGEIEIKSDSALIEKIGKSLNPSMNNKMNQLVYRIKNNKYLYVKFFVEKDNYGNKINSWYEEVWEKQDMPILTVSPFDKE